MSKKLISSNLSRIQTQVVELTAIVVTIKPAQKVTLRNTCYHNFLTIQKHNFTLKSVRWIKNDRVSYQRLLWSQVSDVTLFISSQCSTCVDNSWTSCSFRYWV